MSSTARTTHCKQPDLFANVTAKQASKHIDTRVWISAAGPWIKVKNEKRRRRGVKPPLNVWATTWVSRSEGSAKTAKVATAAATLPLPRPKERGHEPRRGTTKEARGNSTKPRRKRGQRGKGPKRQEKREARRRRRDLEDNKGDTRQQLYCVQLDCFVMKQQMQELAATVAAVQEAMSSVVQILTPIKTLVSTLPVIQKQVQQLSLRLLCRCEGQAAYITGEDDYLCSICEKDHKQCYLCASNCEVRCYRNQTTWKR